MYVLWWEWLRVTLLTNVMQDDIGEVAGRYSRRQVRRGAAGRGVKGKLFHPALFSPPFHFTFYIGVLSQYASCLAFSRTIASDMVGIWYVYYFQIKTPVKWYKVGRGTSCHRGHFILFSHSIVLINGFEAWTETMAVAKKRGQVNTDLMQHIWEFVVCCLKSMWNALLFCGKSSLFNTCQGQMYIRANQETVSCINDCQSNLDHRYQSGKLRRVRKKTYHANQFCNRNVDKRFLPKKFKPLT